jgi:hypothetical protein
MADFWTDPSLEPKRAYRWYVSFGGAELADFGYLCKRVDKPSFTVSETEHTFINHKFYYPGRVDWSEISMTFIDIVTEGTDGPADAVLSALVDAGYVIPASGDFSAADKTSISKNAAYAELGNIYIRQINAAGEEVEKWTLHNPWIKSIKLGSLEYGNDSMMTVDIGVRYDWATYESSGLGSTKLWSVEDS